MSNTSYSFKENSHVIVNQGGEKKVMKKILSVALSTAMAFSMFASVAFGADAQLTPEQKFIALKEAKIVSGFPDGLAHLDRTLTRAELAKIIVKTLSLEPVDATSYNDKNYANHWGRPYIEAATAAGILNGKNPTKKLFDPNGAVTVQELAKVLKTALNLPVPEDANNNNNASTWAKDFVAAVVNAGYLTDVTDFQANATRSQAVVAAYAIYEAAQVPTVKSYKVVDSKNVEFTLSNDEVVKVTLEKALEANKETEVTFKTKDGVEIKTTVKWELTSATKVESVSANNLKEVVVTFDGTVDEVSAEQIALYSVVRDITGANALDIDKATVSEDKKSVVLTLKNSLINNTVYKVSVTNVKTGGPTNVTAKDVKFTAVDVVAPTVEKVEALGNSAVKVTFSEPVNVSDKSAASNFFQLDGKVISGTLNVSGNTVIIKSFTKLADGEHSLIAKKAIVDYAGYPVVEKSYAFNVVADTTAPTIAEVKDVTFESATIVFSEDVDPSTVSGSNIYWLDGSQKRYAESGYDKQIDGKTFKISFTGLKKLPSYATDLFVNGVKDYSGNQITADSKITVNAVIDTARPEIASFTFNKNTNKSVTLKFTKSLDTTTFNGDNVVVKDSDGKVVANIYTASWANSNKDLTINFANALKAGTYSFELTGLKDATTLANTMLPFTETVTVADLAQPTLVNTVVNVGSFILNFDKKMAVDGEGSILNPANYYATYTVDGNTVTGQLPEGTTYETLADQKSVLIKVPSGVTVSALSVQGVRSAAGNVLVGYVQNALATQVANFDTLDAKAIARNEVLVKFNQPVASAVKESFALASGAVATDAWVDASDNTLVHVKFADGTLAANAADTINVTPRANTQSIAGVELVLTPTARTLKDAIKPEIEKDANGKIVIAASGASNAATAGIVFDNSADTITVRFTEAIDAPSQDVAGQLFSITKSNGEKLVYGVDYTAVIPASPNDKTIVFTLTDADKLANYHGVLRIALNNNSNYITDKSTDVDFDTTTPLNNAVASFDVANDSLTPNAIVFDYAAPVAAVVPASSSAATLALSFDESTVVAVTGGTATGVVTTATAATTNTITFATPATAAQTVIFTATDALGNVKTYTGTFNGTTWTLS